MKLVFPNGEYGQVLLSPGVNRVGSAADAAILLDAPGIAERHCEINLQGTSVSLVPISGAGVSVNGRPVRELIALRPGDQLSFAGVVARIVGVEAAQSQAAEDADEPDPAATRIRQAVPRYVLRTVSGPLLGRVFPLAGPTVIGRADEADIAVPDEGVSRRHVRLKPLPDGVAVEDLDSANGTFVANHRVREGFLRPGEELRLDSVRFLLVVPGQEMPRPASPPAAEPRSNRSTWVGLGLILLGLAALAGFWFWGG